MPQQVVTLCDKTTGLKVGKECGKVVEKSDGRISVVFATTGPELVPDEMGALILPDDGDLLEGLTPQLRHFCTTGHANFWLHLLLVMHPREVAERIGNGEHSVGPSN